MSSDIVGVIKSILSSAGTERIPMSLNEKDNFTIQFFMGIDTSAKNKYDIIMEFAKGDPAYKMLEITPDPQREKTYMKIQIKDGKLGCLKRIDNLKYDVAMEKDFNLADVYPRVAPLNITFIPDKKEMQVFVSKTDKPTMVCPFEGIINEANWFIYSGFPDDIQLFHLRNLSNMIAGKLLRYSNHAIEFFNKMSPAKNNASIFVSRCKFLPGYVIKAGFRCSFNSRLQMELISNVSNGINNYSVALANVIAFTNGVIEVNFLNKTTKQSFGVCEKNKTFKVVIALRNETFVVSVGDDTSKTDIDFLLPPTPSQNELFTHITKNYFGVKIGHEPGVVLEELEESNCA